MSNIDFDKLWQIVLSNQNRIPSRIHGPEHWARVERNGLYLCQANGADEEIIRLFTYLVQGLSCTPKLLLS